MTVRLRDVAVLAGVSPMSVSRVLNGTPTVAPEIVARVMSAVDETGYRIHHGARNLRSGLKPVVIGLVVDRLDDPYFAQLIAAAQHEAADRNAMLIVTGHSEPAQSDESQVRYLLQYLADGIMIYPAGPAVLSSVPRSSHLVLLGRTAGISGYDSVLVDHFGGGKLAASYLLDQGHKLMAVLVPGEELPAAGRRFEDSRYDRLAGIRGEFESRQLEFDERWLAVAGSTVESSCKVVTSLLEAANGPTAFVGLNSRMTLGIVKALGARLADFGVVGIDHSEVAEFTNPPVATVVQDPSSIGRLGAQLLFRRIHHPSAPLQAITLPMELVRS